MPTKTYYQKFGSWMNRENATNYCQGMNGHLASIHDSQTFDLLVSLFDEQFTWIGGYKSGGTWKWSDGSAMSFTKWDTGDGQPSGNNGENYMLLAKDGFHDVHDSDFPFICQFQFGTLILILAIKGLSQNFGNFLLYSFQLR